MSGPAVVVVVVVLLLGYPVAFAVRAGLAGRRGGLPDRAGVVGDLAGALAAVVLTHRLGPWQVLPPLLWGLPVAAPAFGALAGALAWRALPVVTGRRPRWRLADAGLSAAVGAGLLGVVLLG